ncbi:trypsin-like serine peptidase [Thetidibacter halocola]|nr:serine protease [Thetidibacter halocola]
MRLALALILLTCLPAFAQDAVGRVNLGGYHSRSMCSGTLIRPDLVLTAAHCVANAEDGYAHPIKDMVFVAGWNGEGHAGAARAASVEVHPLAFAQGRLDIAHDMALIVLQESLDVPGLPIGSAAPQGPFTIMGYRGSRSHRLSVDTGCVGNSLGPLLRVACAVEQGLSGGPVVYGEGDAQRVVAVVVGRLPGAGLAVPVDSWLRRAIAQSR